MLITIWIMALVIMAVVIVALVGVIIWQRLVIRVVSRVARDAGAQAGDVDKLVFTIVTKGSH